MNSVFLPYQGESPWRHRSDVPSSSSSSASALPASEASLEDIIAGDLKPETRQFMLLQPPRRRNNSGHRDSYHDDETPRNDGANEPPSPTRALTGLHSGPPSSLLPVDTVSIQGAFSSAPVRFHRVAEVPTTGGVGTPSSAAAASHEFSRPAMTTFGDPNRRSLRQRRPSNPPPDVIVVSSTPVPDVSPASSLAEEKRRRDAKNSPSVSPSSSTSSPCSSTTTASSRFSFDNLLGSRGLLSANGGYKAVARRRLHHVFDSCLLLFDLLLLFVLLFLLQSIHGGAGGETSREWRRRRRGINASENCALPSATRFAAAGAARTGEYRGKNSDHGSPALSKSFALELVRVKPLLLLLLLLFLRVFRWGIVGGDSRVFDTQ